MIYVPLGESEEIGASCHFLELFGTGLLLDAGVDPELDGMASVPRLDLVRDNPDRWIDNAFVTHAHHDHIGALPVVLQQFPHAIAHMTRATEQLAEVLLPASARLQRRKQRESALAAAPIFEEEELEAYRYLYRNHELEVPFDVTGPRGSAPVWATLYDAGHVLGSAGILLEARTNGGARRIFYTGDTCTRPQAVIPAARFPDPPIDVLLLETTLGADPETENTTRKAEELRLAEDLAAVLKRGGAALMPVFALGRGQEMLALIDRFKKRRLIPEETPVYTAGLMRAISDVYDKTRFTTPRLDEDFQVFGVAQTRLPRSDAATTAALSEPAILVVGSGMMFEHTISNRIAQQLVSSEKNGVFLVGYTRPGSPGHLLLEAAREGKGTEVVLDPVRGAQPVNCSVGRYRFSGHSHRRELIQIVEDLKPRRIVLLHGETDARAWMADNINFFYPEIEIYSPRTGEVLELEL